MLPAPTRATPYDPGLHVSLPISEQDRRDRRDAARRHARRRMVAQRATMGVAVAAVVAFALASHAGSDASTAPHARAQSHTTHQKASPAAPPHRHLSQRQRAVARTVAWARAQNGFHEIGTTNCAPAITRWMHHMGLPQPSAPPCRPWCGTFLHEAFYQGGFRMSARLIDPNESYWDAIQGHNGLRRIPKDSVKAGDIVFFALDPGVQASHEALVLGPPVGGKVPTAEGNVGHHAVVTRRGLPYIVLAARVTRRPARA